MTALALSVSVPGLVGFAAAQDASQNAAPAANPSPLAGLSQRLAEEFPSLRALVIANGNCVAFEYYRKNSGIDAQAPVYSVTKSVLSILVGIARDEGYLHLDERLSQVFPEEFDGNVDPRARDITIRDLLTKTEGFAEAGEGDVKMSASASGKPEVWRWMLDRKVKYPPGTHFRYDNVGSDLLSVVLSKAIRQNAAVFARQKLFDPLQIKNYTWPSDSEGFLHGESGLSLTARDMAKIGILYLQQGRWGDAQIVSSDYVQDSTSKHNDGGPPLNAAYGYQWWINQTASDFDAFFAAGRGGQLIYVVPGRNLVLAVSAESIPGGSQAFVNNVVLPAAVALPDDVSCLARFGQSRYAD